MTLFATTALAQEATQPAAQSASPAPQAAPAQSEATPNQPQSQDQAPAEGSNPTVTVTAQKPPVQNKIDRQVYDVKQDPQAQTGSAGDVMNNVPGVTVDADGTVALRGNTGVQVYVNGKPSSQMSADNRASTLQSMAADDIDSIEVMTNPSSAYGADAGGGIVNIVLKKNRKMAPTASINAMAGAEGRGGFGINGSRTFGKLTLSGGMNARHWVMKRESDTQRTRINPLTNAESDSTQHSISKTLVDNLSGRVQADYTLTDYSSLSAEINVSKRERTGYEIDETKEFDSAGNPTTDTARIGTPSGPQKDAGITIGYDWRGKDVEGETFKMQARLNSSSQDRNTDFLLINNQPATGNEAYRVLRNTDSSLNAFSGDWVRPLAEHTQLTAGWDIQHSIDKAYSYQSLFLPVGTPEQVDNNRTNQFDVDQTISAAYVTYQTLFGKWGVLAGLRVENLDQDLSSRYVNASTLAVTASEDHNSYVTWSPSLYVTYDLKENNKLKGTYSHKIQRPQASLLNPFISYRDAYNVSSGNPDLKPQAVDTFELAYEHTTQKLTWSTTAYLKDSKDTFTFVSQYLTSDPDVLLTSTVNSGTRRETGVEFSINGTPNKIISYSLSGNLGYSEQDTFDAVTGDPLRRAGQTSNLKGRISYKPNTKDTWVVQVRGQGKSPTSQGYRTGFATMDLSYAKVITPKLRMMINAQDIFNSNTFRTVTETSIIQSETESRSLGRTVFVGLNYTFGTPRAGDRDRDQWRGREGGPPPGGQGGPGGPGSY